MNNPLMNGYNMTNLISTKELGKALKLSKPTSLLDQARKHFKNELLKEIVYPSCALPHGGYAKKQTDIFLTKPQAEFLVCRSRGDVANAALMFDLNVLTKQALLRNEIFFMNLIDSILTVTEFKLQRQYPCNGLNIDGIILGSIGVIVIEYDERQHGSSKTDGIRMELIQNHFESIDLDVFIIRVDDATQSIVEAVGKISEIIHSDCIGSILYNDKSYKYIN